MGYTTLTATLKCICNDPFTDVLDKLIQSCSTMAVASGLDSSVLAGPLKVHVCK